jgi:hypothetical protein
LLDPAAAHPLVAAAIYGLSMLAAGWVFGPIRVLFVAPRIGPTLAVFVEAPVMLGCAAMIAAGLLRHGWVRPTLPDRLMLGVLGATIAVVGEFVTAAMFWGPQGALGPMATLPGRIGLLLAATTAVLPLVLPRPAPRASGA